MPIEPVVDTHFHSSHSGDSDALLNALCRQAPRLGLTHICPTEHADFDPRDPYYNELNVGAYSRDLEACRAELDGRVVVLKGVEVDYQPRFDARVRDFLARHPFDFVIGSVHFVDGLYVGDALLETHDRDTAYRRYFDAVRVAAASGLFDVLGHLDLLKRHATRRWGTFDAARYADEIEAVLRAAVETGTGLEINTSGLRQAPAETYPRLETLRRYRELGGEILTLGSDAHRTANLGKDVREGLELARAAGFKAIAVFVARQPQWLDI
jgi:histidinol-phosphatase (PHP family)